MPSASVSESAATQGAARRQGSFPVWDLIAIGCVVIVAGLIVFVLRHLLTRPFYYDEGWRAYEIAQGARFLGHLPAAVGPLSFGYLATENVARVVLGDTEAGLRTPMFLVYPVLGVATYLLARRWLGVAVSFCVAGLLLANLWIINYGLQLKSYSYEALFAVVTVALYLLLRRTAWRPAPLLGLYAALGLTCVFSLPNLFVIVPLLALDLAETVRARDRIALRLAGEALAGAIALAHYFLFLAPQSGVVGTSYFNAQYPPPGIGGFARFTVDGLKSWIPGIITGVAGANNWTPKYSLPPLAHHLLAIGLVILLAAGVVAASREVAGRALVVACGGALLFELVGSARHYWPFGLIRQNLLIVPMLYVLGGIGAARLARSLRGPRRAQGAATGPAWWRLVALAPATALFAVTMAAGGVATARTFAESSGYQTGPTVFGGVKDAVAVTRQAAVPGDLVIIRVGRSTPVWYGTQWLYYMESYAGWPGATAGRPRIPAQHTLSVVYVTPAAADRFLAAHRGSPAVFLMELNLPPGDRFPRWAHQESLQTLRRFGYCPVRDIAYPLTGHLTILKAGCPPT